VALLLLSLIKNYPYDQMKKNEANESCGIFGGVFT
jgi:hypothetical protein